MAYIHKHQQNAVAMALSSPCKFRLGAVLAIKNRTLSYGVNRMGHTHPMQEKFNPKSYPIGVHAEVDACIKLDIEQISGSTIYIARVLRDNSLAIAKPCNCCHSFLSFVGVRRAYYSTPSGFMMMEI